ncbi:hypothetical protein KBK19_17330 [Microvirga sp. STR05]|uniref:Uncharacterized protein n=1 Tax=Hymenobacter duratus TaxID=2771356 RepID=A0ABR8JLP6_9BACT|nr:hypothetical protein [Hymenobacter duratus]MBD2716810.1 hypothetical protein [Hymenobacter duratus]MBR7951725.1 hypothetical protein [Microvirga sp. STR05]
MLLFLLGAGGLRAEEGLAQSLPPGKPTGKTQRQLVVTLTLPSAVGVVKDYATILFSGDEGKDKKAALKRAPRTSNPVMKLTLPLPGNWGGSKDAARTPQK